MNIIKNITKIDIGSKFGHLTVIDKGLKGSVCKCQCDCGNIVEIRAKDLLNKKRGRKFCSRKCKYLKEVYQKASITKRKKNDFFVKDHVIYLIMSNTDKFCLIDEEDYNKIKDYCWSLSKAGYAVAREGKFLHKMFCPNTKGFTDHINGNTLDNRKCNLRPASVLENNRNHKVRKDNSSGVSGVVWLNASQKWSAVIYLNQRTTRLGSYTNINDAIKARLRAEKKYFGEFAPQKDLFEKYGIDKENNNE